jgi:repressor LexA
MAALGYKSPRSASLVLEELRRTGFLKKKSGGWQLFGNFAEDVARTTLVPLVGNVSCGPLMLAEGNIEALIPVSTALARPGAKYFLLRAIGNSMNRAGIQDGDVVLVRQQPDADSGQKVVALIDDMATIKEYRRERNVVILKPCSSDPKHQPIILTDDFHIQGVVVATLPGFH